MNGYYDELVTDDPASWDFLLSHQLRRVQEILGGAAKGKDTRRKKASKRQTIKMRPALQQTSKTRLAQKTLADGRTQPRKTYAFQWGD